MNSIKTLFVLGILAAVAYGVYVSINKNPAGKLPPEAEQGWSTELNVEVPEPGAVAKSPAGPFGSQAGGPPTPGNQTGVGDGSMAPRFSPPSGTTVAPAGGMATPASPRDYSGDATGRDQPPGGIRPGMTLPPPGPTGVTSTVELPSQQAGNPVFARVMEEAHEQLDRGGLVEVLETLSQFYGDPTLTAEQNRQLTDLLSQLAGTVIYSRQHLLEQPHVVQPGEGLQQIARSYNVPWQLLAKINGIRDPQNLRPGQRIKVVRGPFSAVVHLDRYELVLMLQGRYAGRFPIGIGRDQEQLKGVYEVKDKTIDPSYYGPDRFVDAGDPNNPLGERWIGLGKPGSNILQTPKLGIHGTNDPGNIRTAGGRGSICLGDRDIEDVYDILSIGSRVVIQR